MRGLGIIPSRCSNEKFKNKYRIASIRLPFYDYTQKGAYFVTMCVKNHRHYFGEIVLESGECNMGYSILGHIARKYWLEIPNHFANVFLDEWIVMPNHIHGIIIIETPFAQPVETRFIASPKRQKQDLAIAVTSDMVVASPKNHDKLRRDKSRLYGGGGITRNFNPMLSHSLSTIVRWYKGRTTYEVRKIDPAFAWQSRFYEHVIRNENDLNSIAEYILYNPQNWDSDDYFN